MSKELYKNTFSHCVCVRHCVRSQILSTAPDADPVPELEPHPKLLLSTPQPHRDNTNNFESTRFEFNIEEIVQREAMLILDVGHNCTRSEVILIFRLLSQRNHPHKWTPEHNNSKSTCADNFKIVRLPTSGLQSGYYKPCLITSHVVPNSRIC